MSNTGRKIYTTLQEIYLDSGLPTGQTKNNIVGDPDYIYPVYDPISCPLSGTTSTTTIAPTTTTTSTTIPFVLNTIIFSKDVRYVDRGGSMAGAQFIISIYGDAAGTNLIYSTPLTIPSGSWGNVDTSSLPIYGKGITLGQQYWIQYSLQLPLAAILDTSNNWLATLPSSNLPSGTVLGGGERYSGLVQNYDTPPFQVSGQFPFQLISVGGGNRLYSIASIPFTATPGTGPYANIITLDHRLFIMQDGF